MFKKIRNTVNKVREVNQKITSFTSFLSGSKNEDADSDFDDDEEEEDFDEDDLEEEFEADDYADDEEDCDDELDEDGGMSMDEYQDKMNRLIERLGGLVDCNTSSSDED